MMRAMVVAAAAATLVGACASNDPHAGTATAAATLVEGEQLAIAAAERTVYVTVAGTAEPVQQAMLGTRLMGTVIDVAVREGDVVRHGQPLLRIDSRDLDAKASQLEASLAEAQAVHGEAELHARRMRALYDDDAAPRAQLDAAESALVRARSGVEAVRAGALELAAVREYAVVRAPFDGVVVSRMVDPGSFATPGAPLLIVHDVSALRVSGTAAPETVRGLGRGQQVTVHIEGVAVMATVEGVVPAAGGSLYTINAIVANPSGELLPRGAATIALPQGVRSTYVVPRAALVRQGDMTGVYLRRDGAQLLRWVRTGPSSADSVEVLSGLRDGDVIVVPAGR
jgi:RND family efflux transporter MFP subunit